MGKNKRQKHKGGRIQKTIKINLKPHINFK